MTVGIYVLLFDGYDKVYIGQSINIESRYKQHCTMLLANNHYNYKLTYAYKKFFTPSIEILEECIISELDALEISYIDEFDSLTNGLNIVNGGKGPGSGVMHSMSKYSREDILYVFELLCANTTPRDIEAMCGVKNRTIQAIQSGLAHIWLKEEFPDSWGTMYEFGVKRRDFTAEGTGKTYPDLLGPNGVVYSSIPSISEFAKEHSLDRSAINKVLNGKANMHKGFKLNT